MAGTTPLPALPAVTTWCPPPREVSPTSLIISATSWLEKNREFLQQVQREEGPLFNLNQLEVCLNMHGVFAENPSPLTGGLLVEPSRHAWMRSQFDAAASPEQMAHAQRELAGDLLQVLEAIEVRAETAALVGPRTSFCKPPVVSIAGFPAPPPLPDAKRFRNSAAFLVTTRPDAAPPAPKRPLISETSLCRIITDKTTSPTRVSLGTRNQETYDFLKTILYEDGTLRERAPVEGLVEATPRYQVKRVLGRGGMGLVLLADEPALGREVVIKLMFTGKDESLSEGVWDLFDNEMTQQGSLIGMEGLLPAFGRSETIDGHPFLITQRCKGNLEDLLASHTPDSLIPLKGRLLGSWREAVRYLEGVVASIARMHEKDLVHSDIKPGNVLVGLGDEPLTSDFGLAQKVDPETGRGRYEDGTLRGTAGYMAPEAASQAFYSKQNDVFALGCLIYEMLTGIHPVDDVSHRRGGPDIAPPLARLLAADWAPEVRPLAAARAEHMPKFLPPALAAEIERDIPEKLEEVVRRCLAVDPAKRYKDASELLTALREVLARLAAEPFWNEAMAELGVAEGAQSADMTAWTTHARTAFYKAVEAIRRYPDPLWLGKTMQVLYATLEYAERIGDEMLIGQIRQDMDLIKNMIPKGEESSFQPVVAIYTKARTPGHLRLMVTAPPGVVPRVTLSPLREIDGVVRVPQGAPLADLSDHLRPNGDSLTLGARIPRGSYLVRAEAKGCAPMQEVFFLPREGEAEAHLHLLDERLVPKGFVPIAGGRVCIDLDNRAYNIPSDDPHSWAEVPPFLVAKTPVTNRQYFAALVLHASETSIDDALRYNLPYFGKAGDFIQRCLNRLGAKRKTAPATTLLEVLGELFSSEKLMKDFTDSDGDPIPWDAQAVWVSREGALLVAKRLGGRLPTVNQMRRIIVGGDRRRYPWGDSPPVEGDGNFNLGHRLLPFPLPVGTSPLKEPPRGFLDKSPLDPSIINVTARVWTSEQTTPEYDPTQIFFITAGIGYNFPFHSPLIPTLGPKGGRSSTGTGIRLFRDVVLT